MVAGSLAAGSQAAGSGSGWELASGEEAERRGALPRVPAEAFWSSAPKEEIFEDAMAAFPSPSHALGLLAAKRKAAGLAPLAVGRAKAHAPGGYSSAVVGWNEMSASQKLSHFTRPGLCRHLQRENNPTTTRHEAIKSVFRSCGEGAADRKRYQVVQALPDESDMDGSERSDDDMGSVDAMSLD